MAYKMYRKKPTRRLRRFKRKARGVRKTKLPQGKVYSFKRTCALSPWYFDGNGWVIGTSNLISNSAASQGISGIFKFRLEDVPNPTDFTMLFEQFKITGVKLRFIPMIGTESSGGATALAYTETLAYAIDRGANDQVFFSPSMNTLMENQDVKLRNSQRPFSIWIGTPTFHQPADGLAQGAYKSGWLDGEINSARQVDFHGLKWAFPSTRTDATSCWFRVYATYYIKCRNPQ